MGVLMKFKSSHWVWGGCVEVRVGCVRGCGYGRWVSEF